MNEPARLFTACAVVLMVAVPVAAQVNYQATPAPLVTAENEPWYAAGEPVMFAGHIYYPTGPQVHFNGNEMVRSGFFHAIPLYTRTTIEPYSKVFVPISGGLMQPYERRREGEMAGTVGSTAPSFPVARSSEAVGDVAIRQAAAPPGIIGYTVTPPAQPAVSEAPPEQIAGTTGTVMPPVRARAPVRPPQGHHGLFIEFDGQRWFGAGKTAPLDTLRLRPVGEHHGLTVYADPADPGSIFVPVTRISEQFVARYSRRPAR